MASKPNNNKISVVKATGSEDKKHEIAERNHNSRHHDRKTLPSTSLEHSRVPAKAAAASPLALATPTESQLFAQAMVARRTLIERFLSNYGASLIGGAVTGFLFLFVMWEQKRKLYVNTEKHWYESGSQSRGLDEELQQLDAKWADLRHQYSWGLAPTCALLAFPLLGKALFNRIGTRFGPTRLIKLLRLKAECVYCERIVAFLAGTTACTGPYLLYDQWDYGRRREREKIGNSKSK